MKKLLAILFVTGAFIACNNAPESTEDAAPVDTVETTSPSTLDSSAVITPDSTVTTDTTQVH